MKYKGNLLLFIYLLFAGFANAQLLTQKAKFTYEDTLRGSITTYRQGWDVLRYDLQVEADIQNKTISGNNKITYYESLPVREMQIDLQKPLMIDSVISENGTPLTYKQLGNAWLVRLKPDGAIIKFLPGKRWLKVYYHGVPKVATRPPWDGGLIWHKDSLNNPLVATACQGLGASVWWPCKDHQSDEPDSGMTIKIIAPDTLSAISNGRLQNVLPSANGTKTWTWLVTNPINNYDVTMNIGKYTHWSDTLQGVAGILDMDFWVLNYNLEKAKRQFAQAKLMLRSFEYWFGKYPFYEDSYKLIETPFLGMEHQSGVAYGNKYGNGYLGTDLSGTGWGLKWDFIIIHESGHEWFGNNITSKDLGDMWLHEGFTNYSETLFTETYYGKQAANDYNFGTRKKIKNNSPVIGPYGVNEEGSGDMYSKGGNLLQLIRHSIDNDSLFRNILVGLNTQFYHATVTTQQVEDFISTKSGIDFSKIFDQYLRTTQIPVLEFYTTNKRRTIHYRWSKCVDRFNLSLVLNKDNDSLRINPTTEWQTLGVKKKQQGIWSPAEIEKNYYIKVDERKKIKSDKS